MIAFFTLYKDKKISKSKECNAIDIAMKKYTIRIRENGILIKENKTQKEIHNIDLR